MIEEVEIAHKIGLREYAGRADLRAHVHELESVARTCVPKLAGRTLWMINSTAQGGGVAEMLPKLVGLLRELGVSTRWVVMKADEPSFFPFTKRLHNLLHGAGEAYITEDERGVYARVSERVADALCERVAPGDLLLVHDPQPALAGARVVERLGLCALWNCHIGVDRHSAQTEVAWSFLAPYVRRYAKAVFSAAEYIPSYLTGMARVIPPALDPLSHKNRPLTPVKLTGIACNAHLLREHAPVLTPPFPDRALRLSPAGTLLSADAGEEIGLLYRPSVVQISRWDRLKGYAPLLDGFCEMKRKLRAHTLRLPHRQQRRLEIVRLVLAGPDPQSVGDDPEAAEVFEQLSATYRELPPSLQQDIALLQLPMRNLKHNALMVNVLQRAASVVVQNSIEEGFGLSVTEAAWKGTAVVGSSACGIRQQIRPEVDGFLIPDPKDPEAVCETLLQALSDPLKREQYAHSAQLRVHDKFLVFTQLSRWIELLGDVVSAPPTPAAT